MCQTVVHLLILVPLSCLSFTEDKTNVPASCPDHQKAFRGSCYELVDLQHTFFSAQGWCEQHGGHLAFIPDEETQYFLQGLLDAGKDVWLGVAPSASPKLQYPATGEGALSWLDGSPITYSNWVSSPQPGASCGHILRDSAFQWKTTRDCNKSLRFICQFDSGRSIVCAGRNTTLQCGSGQVLMIDGGIYGRKSMHYCRSTLPSPTASTEHRCDWVDVVQSLTAYCQGRQVCQISSQVVDSFGEPCPRWGSYLSVDHHCKDGLTLSVDTVAAVFDGVTISVKWLLNVQQGNLSCKLSTGDGHVTYLHSPEGFESSVVHRYTRPSTFVVAVECTSRNVHITAQKIISIEEPITVFGVIRCYAGKASFQATNCKALHGEPFHIQMDVKAGTNVTYRILSDEKLISGLSVFRGNVPQNITVTPEMMKQPGPGCQHLTLYASNKVTFPEVSTDLQMCLLEKVAGLQASVLTERDYCQESQDITVGVTLERGAPVLLLFSLTGDNRSYSETREMNSSKSIFHIGHPIKGPVQVKLKAWNIFSFVEVDVDMFAFCGKNSVVKLNGPNDYVMRPVKPFLFPSTERKKHIRVARSSLRAIATPSYSITNKNQNITLSLRDSSSLNDRRRRYEWSCNDPCGCQVTSVGLTYTIEGSCLPEPLHFNKYYFKVIKKSNNRVEKTESICVILDPERNVPAGLSLSCAEGCYPIVWNRDATIQMNCDGQCPQVVWNLLDIRDDDDWEDDIDRDCYRDANKRPLVKKSDGGTQYTVEYYILRYAQRRNRDLTVVITSADVIPIYHTYTIRISSSSTSGSASTSPGTTSDTTRTPTTLTPAGPASTSSGSTSDTTNSSSTGRPASTSPGTTSDTNTRPTTAGPASTSSGTSSDTTTAPTTSYTGDTSPPATTNNDDSLRCSISPRSGTNLDAFTITCNTEIPCPNCQYCFKTHTGKHLRCSTNLEVKSVFLPLGDRSSNYKLIITATAKNSSVVATTTITAKVSDSTDGSSPSVHDLGATVENTVAQLKEQGLLSGEIVGPLLNSVSDQLNSQSDESNIAERQKLRKKMLDIMIDTVKEAPTNSPEEVQVIASGLASVAQKGSELSTAAQEEASLLVENLSSSLLHMDMNKTEENINAMHSAASTIMGGASNILEYSSNKKVSDALLSAMDHTQTALLALKDVNEGPTTIQQGLIGMLVNRVTPDSLHNDSINIPNSSKPTFSLPTLASTMLPSGEPMDIRMLSMDKNPFSWNERGNISGQIGSLSLTTKDGSGIPVENLSEDIEILLPRPVGEQVNTSVLDLRNFSTMVIVVPSADTTLVLKMVPSKHPLPFKLFLGYKDYPTETNHVAKTEMPHQGVTQEERYTWLLDPETLKGDTGVHYLVVRPIVGPGIKSINASLSITSVTAACKFWNESILEWNQYGCRVGVQTTHLVTQCLCNHLTFFGSSFFVTPNLVDASRTAELFGTFAENPVVVCFVGSLLMAYLLVVVWARRKDIQDTAKVKVTVLEDNDPMDEYRYLLSVSTGYRKGASTSSQVTITLLGAEGSSEPHHLTGLKKCVFERGAVDLFLLTTPFSLGDLQGIRLWHNNSGGHPAWYVGHVMVQDLQTEQKWHFLCKSWLAIDMGDCSLDKVFAVSTEMDLKRFSNLFFMKTIKDFNDGHLWYSVINRPPSSTFTCVQRVSCCFSLLFCTMLTSIMFYGIPTDPSEQTMDLGHFEFTWQQFMVGVQSSLIMFPVNILIVSIFRNTRPQETSCCKRKTKKTDALEQTSSSQTTTSNMNVDVTLDTVIRDITRIAHSLSKTVKSNIPCTESEFGPGQQVDINAVLSVVEDFIKQKNKTSDTTQTKAQSFSNLQPQLPEGSASLRPGATVEGIQKKSNKTQYLYRQLCHIDKELSLLGPSGFPTAHSYSRALQQVQGMKGSLEDQLFTLNCVSPDELTHKRLSAADSTDGDRGQKKRACCHGGLPWWFIFVGWLLVIGSTFVAGYYTMLYGLKFGKERSVSWLVSMIVSFFQSVLVIQPLKVLCLGVFFALVIKKVDDDDFQDVAFEGNDRNPGDCKGQQVVRRDSSLYEPPLPADIEKMKRNKMMEQKAFALFMEILTYMGFMWMLLLVAYGQRDPNAFFLNRHIRHSFSKGITDSMSLEDVFTWAKTSLLSNLFGVYPGFITDGNSKLVGNARLRQLRVQKGSCQTADPMLQFVPDCHALYSWDAEDVGSYDPGWNNSVRDNRSTSISSPWAYQTEAQLRAHPVWGKMVIYRGGGFAVELGPDSRNASRTLEYLFRNTWLDMYTRAIIVEFTVYNANVNLFCIVTLLLETTAAGAFEFHSELQSVRLYQSTGSLHIFVMAAEIIYLLFILHSMFLQGKLMKQQRCAYFRNKWNLLEMTIILLSWSALAVFIKRTLLGIRDMTYYQNHKDQFANFYETATADSMLQYLIAFLVLLATFKLWHLLRLNPKMNMITNTLQRAWNDISGFLVLIVIMFVAYSTASNVIYGWKISSYRTLTDALLNIISLQVGIFNYSEVLDSSPVLGGLLFGSCVVFMSFVMLNLLLSVILEAFHQEQIHHKPSDEEEIVDLMLKKICNLFGIRYNNTADTPGPDVSGASGLTLNNSRNILNNSAVDVKTSDNSVNL